METIIEQMKKISISDDPLPLLLEMNVNLRTVPNQEVVNSFEIDHPLSNIYPLFDILNSSNDDQIRACVDILSYILTRINPSMAMEAFRHQYLQCLSHPHKKVQTLMLQQICEWCINSQTDLQQLHVPVVLAIINALADDYLHNVKISQDTLFELCITRNAPALVFEGEGLNALKNVMNKSDSCRFIVYEFCVRVCIASERVAAFITSSQSGQANVIDDLLSEVVTAASSGDVLTQLNALQLTAELGKSNVGLTKLRQAGLVPKLAYLLSSANEDSMSALLLPGLLKFFGYVGASHPQLLSEEEPLVLREILRLSGDWSGSTDASLQVIAFDTVAHIAASVEGKNALAKFNVEMEQTLKDVFAHMSSCSTEIKVRILESFAKLINVSLEEQTEDLVHILESWVSAVSASSSTSAAALLLSIARQPIVETTEASLLALRSLAILPFGAQQTASTPGLVEWLLQRESCAAATKATQEARYGVVEALHAHAQTLDENARRRVAAFITQGPFFVERQPEVALHG